MVIFQSTFNYGMVVLQKYLLIILLLIQCMYSQEEYADQTDYEVFLIDAYVTPEIPYSFVLSFFTSDSMTSEVILDNKYKYSVSKEFNEDHKVKIDISQLSFDTLYVPFMIKLTDRENNKYHSQVFELPLPITYGIKINDAPGLLTTCCFGGVVFGLPSPNFVIQNGISYFSLTKEIPIVTYYTHGYNYPDYYLSLEYTYVFDAAMRNSARVGIKKIFQLDFVEYFSPGVSYYYDFHDTHGIAPELSVGFFKISNVFTLYGKYRFNYGVDSYSSNFHELSIGLFSSFFSLNL